jgi:hypothetical protein
MRTVRKMPEKNTTKMDAIAARGKPRHWIQQRTSCKSEICRKRNIERSSKLRLANRPSGDAMRKNIRIE